MGSGVPRSQLFVKVGAYAPVPYAVGATVSNIPTVNPAGVLESIVLIPVPLIGLIFCYKAVVWLSKGL